MVKSIIVPTAEYADGRNVILTTGRSVYTIVLRHLIEQRAEWSWCAIQISEKKSRTDVGARAPARANRRSIPRTHAQLEGALEELRAIRARQRRRLEDRAPAPRRRRRARRSTS